MTSKTKKTLLLLMLIGALIANSIAAWISYSNMCKEYDSLEKKYATLELSSLPKIEGQSSDNSLEKYESNLNNLNVNEYKLLIYSSAADFPIFRERGGDSSLPAMSVSDLVGKNVSSYNFTIAYINFPNIYVVHGNKIYEANIESLKSQNLSNQTAAFINTTN